MERESMWRLSLGRESGGEYYPERPGEADCMFYMKTGFCRYGANCRYNHPHDRNPAADVLQTGGGEYPERVGQPTCQYFIKTGTCKFGATCKYHHPRYGGGLMSPVGLNILGYPLRPGDKECSYYVKTGQCKFGPTCKFHHPQPVNTSLQTTPAPQFYPTVHSPSQPSPQQYGGGMASWQVARSPFLPGSYVQGPYSPVILHPGVVPLPGWSAYPPPVTPVASPGAQQPVGTGSLYGLSPTATPYPGFFSPVSSSVAGPSGTKENTFPERPGQPECQFYMRTGDCKYGSTCRYHHPPDRIVPQTNCTLSPIGFPLRPGAPTCSFYAQHGVCKFGPTCKFDHPLGSLSYSPSASSLADMPVAPYPVGSSLATLAPSSSSTDLSGAQKSSENPSSSSMGSSPLKGTQSLQTQTSAQSSTPSSSSSTTGHGTENPSSI
ncbi:zinc finger CCCH domain-containing protein 32 isoform X2 [Amborella trichopoda]|uniref:zinc finger CCCH domain-containing protein 32 isoform X2 n=1 Tax=Amborella trichopoda TaxID=13333 RepID=UPI0009C145D5|nr:zinc finger CCCH domain-containing protein 32 isoform X2 [Amborella trichopoda]|eukprot:XP_020529734.1 zinc finger CCCH domain-containing protein 32 isoform X2 [Amborella trichopoda]